MAWTAGVRLPEPPPAALHASTSRRRPDWLYRDFVETGEDLRRAGFEHVHVENDRYDGPQAGVADINGVPHYFLRLNHYFDDGDEFTVWPIDEATLALEKEQWRIFVATWDAAGAVAYPNAGVLPDRHHELDTFLAPHRVPPTDARTMFAQWHWDHRDDDRRHDDDGPMYLMRWQEPHDRP